MNRPAQGAIVLFAHGARDAAWVRPLEALRAQIVLRRPDADVRVAYLELQAPRLAPLLDELAARGVSDIDIAPVFWAVGAHLGADLPALLATFGAKHPGVRVRVLPALGELPGMQEFLADSILAQSGRPR